MFGTYWNDASVLRAALTQAGVPDDAASRVADEMGDPVNARWTRFNGDLIAGLGAFFVAGALAMLVSRLRADPEAVIASALPGEDVLIFVEGQGAVPTFLVFGIIAAAFFLAGTVLTRIVATVWRSYRYALFTRVALGGRGSDIVNSGPAAIRHAKGARGDGFICAVVRFRFLWFLTAVAALTVAYCFIAVFGQGQHIAITRDRIHFVPSGPGDSPYSVQLSEIESASAGCKYDSGFRGIPSVPRVKYEIVLLRKRTIDLGQSRVTPSEMAQQIADFHTHLAQVRGAERRELDFRSEGAAECLGELRKNSTPETGRALDRLFGPQP